MAPSQGRFSYSKWRSPQKNTPEHSKEINGSREHNPQWSGLHHSSASMAQGRRQKRYKTEYKSKNTWKSVMK